MEVSNESVAARSLRMNQLFYGKAKCNTTNYLISRDSLIDALFALYDECNNEEMRKDKHIASFIDKFRSAIAELHRLQVNISDFEVKKIIGQGHFGEVQVVREKATGDVYAMKVLRKSDTLSQQSVAFYEEERDIMAKASSPWITKLQYAFQDKNHLYLVMEFHPGGDMLSLLDHNDNQLPEDTAQFYLAELILAIQSLHNMGYVHRDIKPDNILIDRMGHIKLADFGSAAKLSAQKTVLSRMPVGTPDYIAPEVLMAMNGGPASSGEYGVECDWWSLGIVAYEMLFGYTPFSDEKVLATYNNIMNFKKFLKFPEDLEDISESAVELIKGLLQDCTARWGYQQLYTNKFFIDIDWDKIRQTPPPFVPTVSCEDDTSNFDEFEHEVARPSGNDLKSRKEFNGKNLPFIGFTYTLYRNTISDRISISMDNSIASLSIPTSEENRKESQKILAVEEEKTQLMKKIAILEASTAKKESSVRMMESDMNALQASTTELVSEVSCLKRLLAIERKDRARTEEKALEIMKTIKENFQKRETTLTTQLKREIENGKLEKEELKKKLQLIQNDIEKKNKELNRISEELSQSKKRIDEYYIKANKPYHSSKEKEAELHDNIQKISTNMSSQITHLQLELEKSENQNTQLMKELKTRIKVVADLQENIATVRKDKEEAQFQVDGLKNAVFKLESIIDKIEHQGIGDTNAHFQHSDLENKTEMLMAAEEENKKKQKQIDTLKKQLTEEVSFKNKLLDESALAETLLQEEINKNDDLKRQINLREEQLDNKLQNAEQCLSDEKSINQKLEKDLCNMQEKEYEMNCLNSELKSKITSLEVHQKELEKEIVDMRNKCDSNNMIEEDSKQSLEKISYLQQENAYLSTKVGQLDQQIDKVRENLGKQRIRVDDLQRQLKKKEGELSTVQIDLRIARHEAKQAEDIVGSLRDSNRSLREKATMLEKTKIENERKVKQLEEEILEMKKELELKSNEHENENKMFETEKAKLEGNVKSLKEMCCETKELEEKYARSIGKYEEINKQHQDLKDQLIQKEEEKQELLREINKLKTKLSDKIHECDNIELNINVLRPTCMELEDQLNRLEVLVETHEENEVILEKQRDSLRKEIEKLEDDVRNSQEALAKEKRNRVEKELQIEEIRDELQSQKVLHEAELKALNEHLLQQRETAQDFGNQTMDLEKKLSSMEMTMKHLNLTVTALQEENIQVKEEAARHITQISSLKASNLKLSQGLEEAFGNYEDLKEAYQQICDDMDSNQVSHDNEKIKLKQTIAQQTKLIDFLQTKTEAMERKRKGAHFRLFVAKKENITPMPLQYKDLTTKLDKERSKTRRLQERIRATEAEQIQHSSDTGSTRLVPQSPASRAVLSVLAQSSPSASRPAMPASPLIVTGEIANAIQKPQGERMRHSIPHRFEDILCMHARKCVACLDTIHFGRHASRCQECEIICHPKCSTSLPNTCGLPSGYVEHFANALQKEDKPISLKSVKSLDPEEHLDKRKLEGWVKIPRNGKQGWERRYACVNGTKIYIFEKQDEGITLSSALIQIELCPSDGMITINHSVSASELTSTAKSDLPYILKVEYKPQTTCWPPKCHYIMTLNFADKQQWVSVLEKIVEENNQTDYSLESKLLDCCILKHKRASLEINSICVFSDKTALIGAKEGLFVMDLLDFSMKSIKCKIEGVKEVYQISVLRKLNLVVFITGEQRELWMSDLEDVKEWVDGQNLNEPLHQRFVANLDCCHLFAVSENSTLESTYMCVANEEALYLLRWSQKLDTFLKIKEMKFPQTCGCIHFRKNSVIIGADKFYELTLDTCNLKNFLDTSDTSLAFLAYAASELNSYPIAIFQVSQYGKPEEYLLCYNELGVFVDDSARRSREDEIKWAKVPMGFGYHAPYLFVIYFNTVEIIHIFPSNMMHTFLPLSNPQYLGKAETSGTVYISTHDTVELKVLRIRGDIVGEASTNSVLPPILNEEHHRYSDEVSENATEFSFTSSMLQSLDALSTGNTSITSSSTETEHSSNTSI